jgi:hypothetical protein
MSMEYPKPFLKNVTNICFSIIKGFWNKIWGDLKMKFFCENFLMYRLSLHYNIMQHLFKNLKADVFVCKETTRCIVLKL